MSYTASRKSNLHHPASVPCRAARHAVKCNKILPLRKGRLKMKLKRIIVRMLAMCPEAWYIFKRGLQLCALLLFCAFMLLVEWDGCSFDRHALYFTAMSLNETAQAILLIVVLFSVFIEDVAS